MENQDLVKKLKNLRKVQPSQEWFDLTRDNLINQINWEKRTYSQHSSGFLNWMRSFQPVALIVCLLMIFVGGPWLTIMASEVSLPGEFLYSIKRASEGIQTKVASKEKQSELHLEFAYRRLEEFTKIARESSSEKEVKTKQVIDDLKNNLADVSANLKDISKENALTVVKKTIKIKEDIDRAKEEVSLEAQESLVEAEKVIEEINSEILAVLTGEINDGQRNETMPTSTEEILIFLEKTESGAVTTTNKVINGVEEEK